MERRPKIVVIAGPTASGKTALAVELAGLVGGEIVGADSVQVYRRLDIGTAKPTAEQRAEVRHHMIDVADPDESYDAARYAAQAGAAVEEIASRGAVPFVVGGTGLYIRALLGGLAAAPPGDRGLRERLELVAKSEGPEALHAMLGRVDPEAASRIHPNNVRRVVRALEVYSLTGTPISRLQRSHRFAASRFDALTIVVEPERRALYQAIDDRVERMIAEGLVDEARALLEAGYSADLKALRSLGYKEVIEHLAGGAGIEETKTLIKRNTKAYARRQITWFRRERGAVRLPPDGKAAIMNEVRRHLGT
ncbi:MAG TPA: tRNA (adenosine(37)-N6)-dimethylallyltransferase MiaA [Deltaproteobacteria bacterium]|nr:tRNA (adenosine(37)-N6)-dimethylallyltransferase MiaA [Deltaproteobacteria bacterium]